MWLSERLTPGQTLIPTPTALKCRYKKAPTNVEAYLLFTKNNGTRGQT